MAKKELTNNEHNELVWKEIKTLESDIQSLKSKLKPVELPKQADLNACNALARKAVTKAQKVNPKLVAEESGVKK